MTDLYRRNGSAPAPLPLYVHDEDGNAYSAPFEGDLLGELGFELAPPKPDDTEDQFVVWTGDSWVMEDKPVPPAPVTTPKTLGRLGFIRHTQSSGGMTDQMLVDARNAPAFAALWIKLDMAEGVERDDPLTGQALGALTQAGFLPKGAAAVLTSWPLN